MALKEAVTLAGKSLSADKEMLGNFGAGFFLYLNAAQIYYKTATADGNLIDTDPVTGEHTMGHKTEVFLSTTASKAPAIANGLLTLRLGSSYSNIGNSEILNFGKGLVSRFGSGAAETSAETIAADSSVATTVAADTTLTVAGDGIVTSAVTTTPGVFAGSTSIVSTVAGDTALTVGGDTILTTAATTTPGVFASGSTIASTVAGDGCLTLAGDGIVTTACTTTPGVFAGSTTLATTVAGDTALTVGGESLVTTAATTSSSVFASGTTIASTVAADTTLTVGTTGLTATTGAVATTAAETTLVVGEGSALAVGEGTAVAVGEGTALAGGAGLASSILPPVAVGVACYYTGKQAKKAVDIMIDTHDTYKQVDSCFMPGKRDARFQKPTPDILNYKNIVPAAVEVSKLIRSENLSGPVKRTADGRIVDLHQIDFSDPKNRAELVRAIDQQIALDKQTMDQNSSILPRWLRSDDGVMKQEYARMDMHQLESAKTDLANYGQESDAYLAAKKAFDQQNAPAAPVTAAATTPPKAAAAPKMNG